MHHSSLVILTLEFMDCNYRNFLLNNGGCMQTASNFLL